MNEGMKAYRNRWQAVVDIEQQENLHASIEDRWRQLNAVFGLAVGLGLVVADPGEEEGHRRWAKLKNQPNNLNTPR